VVDVSDLLPEPSGYAELLEQLKARVRASRVRAARAATASCCSCTGRSAGTTWTRQEQAGWGSRVIDRLEQDLRAEFPDQRGWRRPPSTRASVRG